MSKVVRAVVGVGLFVAGVFMGGSTWPLAVMALGGGIAASALTPKMELPAVSEATGGRLNTSLEPEAFRKIAFGRTALATDTRYWETYGEDQKNYDEVIALASHRIASVDAVHVEDELVGFDGAGGAIGRYAGALSCHVALEGVSGSALSGVGTGARWGVGATAATSMTGVAHMALKWVYSQEKLPGGPRTRITAVGKGMPLYDPRRDSTRGGSGSHRATGDPSNQSTWEFVPTDSNGVWIGRNPALQILAYILGWHVWNPVDEEWVLVVGMGVDPDDIDFDSFIEAANECEAQEYYADCLLSTGDTHATNLAVLEQACAGRVSDVGGLYRLRIQVNDFSGALVHFTDDDVVGECDWRPEMPLAQEAYNQIAGQFPDPDALYQLRSLPLVRDRNYEDADGERVRTNARLDAVQDGEQAQKLLRLRLNKSRRRGLFEAPFGWRAVNVQPGQPVKLTLSRFGFDERTFRVRATKVDPGGAVWMALESDGPEVYAGGTVQPVPPPGAGAGYDPISVPTPGANDWTISPGGAPVGEPGGPGILVEPGEAVASLTGIRSVIVQFRLYGLDPAPVWSLYGEFPVSGLTQIEITGLLPNRQYEVRLQYRNLAGAIDPQATRVFGPVGTGALNASQVDGLSRAEIEAAAQAALDRANEISGEVDDLALAAAAGDAAIAAQVERLDAPGANLVADSWAISGGAQDWYGSDGLRAAMGDRSDQPGEPFASIIGGGSPNAALIHEPRKPVKAGERYELNVSNVALTGSAASPTLQLVVYGASSGGSVIETQSVAVTAAAGLVGGFVTIGADGWAEFRAAATGAGEVEIEKPVWRLADDGQSTLSGPTEREDSRLSYVRRLALATADLAAFQRQIEASSENASVRIEDERVARISETEALAQAQTSLSARATALEDEFDAGGRVAEAEADITALQTATADLDATKAEAATVNALSATVGDNAAKVIENAAAIATLEDASAIYEVLVAASGSNPAIVRLLAGLGGSQVALAADVLRFINDLPGQGPIEAMRVQSGVVEIIQALVLATGATIKSADGRMEIGFLTGGGFGAVWKDSSGTDVVRLDTQNSSFNVSPDALANGSLGYSVFGFNNGGVIRTLPVSASNNTADYGAAGSLATEKVVAPPGRKVRFRCSYRLQAPAQLYNWFYYRHVIQMFSYDVNDNLIGQNDIYEARRFSSRGQGLGNVSGNMAANNYPVGDDVSFIWQFNAPNSGQTGYSPVNRYAYRLLLQAVQGPTEIVEGWGNTVSGDFQWQNMALEAQVLRPGPFIT